MVDGQRVIEMSADVGAQFTPEIEQKDNVFHYRLKDGEQVVASVRVFPFEGIVPSEATQYLDESEKSGVPIVESSIFVHEDFQKRGLGLKVWQEAELEYLKRMAGSKVIRYFADISEGEWSSRNLPKIREFLVEKGFVIKEIWEGTVDPYHVEILEITKNS